MSKKLWSSTEEAAELSGISRTRLFELKNSGDLKAGFAWVYLTGRRTGPIGWNVAAIQQWQVDQTNKVFNASLEAADAIESFAEMGV